MEKIPKNEPQKSQARFQMYNSVVLTKNLRDLGLRKGDRGAIVDVWDSGLPIAYEVDFVSRNITTSILEKHLKEWVSPSSSARPHSATPPLIPDEIRKKEDEISPEGVMVSKNEEA